MVASPRPIPKPPPPKLIQCYFENHRLPQEDMSVEDQMKWMQGVAKVFSIVYDTDLAIVEINKPGLIERGGGE